MLLDIWAELSVYSIPEIIAVLASLTYVILASREHRGCWPRRHHWLQHLCRRILSIPTLHGFSTSIYSTW